MSNTFQEETDKALYTINRSLEEKQVIELAKQQDLGYIDIENYRLNPDLLDLVSENEATQALAIPFFRVGSKMRLAIGDPNLQATKQLVQKLTQDKFAVTLCLASKSGIMGALKLYEHKQKNTEEDFNTNIDELNLSAYDVEIDVLLEDFKKNILKYTSAELLNMILVGGIKTKASDIHFEPKKKGMTIRYRIDGMLQEIFQIPEDKKNDLLSQLKHQAKMKLNVYLRPQDGRFYFVVNEREVDVRVSSLPTPFGEDIVLRILDSKNKDFSVAKLGFHDIAADVIANAVKKPYGMILTTGPTGSGKTTTLYALLKLLNRPESKIITIEDPIEYKLEGITQSQIAEDEDYTFSNGLRSILRQDPDVVMVGEIRDLDTARTAAQAALTGHKVLSTLHTNDAIGAIDRLVNMGLESFMIAPAIDTIIAQRLVRKCCTECVTEVKLNAEQRDLLTRIIERLNTVLKVKLTLPETIKKAKGCNICGQTGYLGRTGLYEVIHFDDEVREMILSRKTETEIRHKIRKDSFSVFEAGIIEVLKGTTTIEEVIRVAKEQD